MINEFIQLDILVFAYFYLHNAFMVICSITHMPVYWEPVCIHYDTLSVPDSYCKDMMILSEPTGK